MSSQRLRGEAPEAHPGGHGPGETTPVAPATQPAVPPEAGRAVASAGLRILLADDIDANRLLFRALLERRGHTCVLAGDGVEAVAAVSAGGIDLVLMDCMMPRLDGWEATREIRARERAAGTPRLPIIALTAYGLPDDRKRSLAAGMDDHLVKPVSDADLAAAIARAVRGPSAARACPAASLPVPAPPADPAAVLVADPLPAPAAAAVDVLDRLGIPARVAPWDADALATAPAVLIAARGDGLAAADMVRALGRASRRPLLLVSVAALRHPATVAVQAAVPDAVVLRPLQGALVGRALAARIPVPPPPAGRPLALDADPGPDLDLDTLRMVEQALPGTAETMLRAFLADLDQAEADLAAAAVAGDRPLIAALAHRLRGGSASLGAGPLAAAAGRLEADPSGDPSAALHAFVVQAAALRRAAAAVRATGA